MKERLISSNPEKNFYVYRVSKKLRKKGGGAVTRCIDIKVAGNKLFFTNSKFYGGNWTSQPLCSITFGKTLVVRSGTKKFTSISYEKLKELKVVLSKYVSKKVNRVCNKHFGTKFKIEKHFVDNIVKTFAPAYEGIFERPTYEMFPIYRTSLKKGLKRHCGFSGKKFIRELLQYGESQQFSCVRAVKWLKPYLQHGDDLSSLRMRFHGNNKIVYKDLFDRNPRLLIDISSIKSTTSVSAYTDTLRLVKQVESRGVQTSFNKIKIEDLEAYHDKLSAFLSGSGKNIPLPYCPEIESMKVLDFEIRSPRSTNELRDWAKYMKNCIAGYETSIIDKSVIMLGFFRDNTLVYNVAINCWNHKKALGLSLNQINTRFNGLKVLADYTEQDLFCKEEVEKFINKFNHRKEEDRCLDFEMEKLLTTEAELLEL